MVTVASLERIRRLDPISASPKSSSFMPGFGHQNIGRLQVAMGDAFSCLGFVESVAKYCPAYSHGLRRIRHGAFRAAEPSTYSITR